MSEVQALLTRCRELGAKFFPQPNGMLKIQAPARLPEDLREALKQRKGEVMALLRDPSLNACGELIISLLSPSLSLVDWRPESCSDPMGTPSSARGMEAVYKSILWLCVVNFSVVRVSLPRSPHEERRLNFKERNGTEQDTLTATTTGDHCYECNHGFISSLKLRNVC